MITGIGTDLVEIARVQKAIGRSAFLERVYTEKERELIAVRSVCAASNFAAKEAVAKAFGCGFAGIAPAEIEVLRYPSGMPYVVLHGRAKEKADAMGISKIRLSITNTKEYAQAYVICESTGSVFDGQNVTSLFTESKRSRAERKPLEEVAISVLDAAGMKEADRITIEELGVPSLVLMERAALAVTACVKEYATENSRIGVLCGTGNNGGDGVAVARLLKAAGYDAEILLKDAVLYRNYLSDDGKEDKAGQSKKPNGTPEFLKQMEIAKAYGVPVCEPTDTKGYDIIVDALFGIGLSKPVEGAYASLTEQINKEPHKVIAVDIASGISASDGRVYGTALRADETVTFGAAKWGHLLYPGKEYTGKLRIADIGFPKSVLWEQRQGFCLDEKAMDSVLPERPADSNKGTFGKVAVFAGSKNMAGAAYFAACAAYRTGAGLVRIVTPECNREILQTLLPEAMLTTYTGEADLSATVKESVSFADTVVVGPGLGQNEAAEALVTCLRDYLRKENDKIRTSVWDADALNILAKRMDRDGMVSEEERIAFLEEWFPENAILTPHPGELSRLLGVPVKELKNSLFAVAKKVSVQDKVTYVLKDAVTLVAKGDACYVNSTGNNGMSTGGSGDILCGVIAALATGGLEPFYAATAGVWLHGTAGDTAANKIGGVSMIAGDMLQAIDGLFVEKGKEVMEHDGV